jgi:hypothetical protein
VVIRRGSKPEFGELSLHNLRVNVPRWVAEFPGKNEIRLWLSSAGMKAVCRVKICL